MSPLNSMIVALLGSTCLVNGARAQSIRVDHRLSGYACVAVATNNRPGDPLAPLPALYSAPSERAPKAGVAQATMIAAEPPKKENGFVAVYFGNGREGWVRANLVGPWHSAASPSARCFPALMSNGLWAFDYGS